MSKIAVVLRSLRGPQFAVAGAILLYCLGLGTASGTVYYVDGAGGSDNADGKAAVLAGAAGPWKTFSKANANTFLPGDSIRLAAGQSWTGQLHPLGSGAAGNPIMIEGYGAGNRPAINAGGTVDAAVRLFNQSYWEIKGLEITNTAAQPGDLRGISVEGCDAGTLSHIYIEDCSIHNVSGEAKYFGSASGTYEIGKRTGGIVFWTDTQTGVKTKFDDVLIRGNTLTDNAFGGIIFKQTNKDKWAMREGGINDPLWYPHTHIRIENNALDQSGSVNNLVAMLLTAVKDIVVSGNFLKEPHQCGIELDYAEDCLVERNEVYHTSKGATGVDACALDFDRCCDRTVWQYNYLNDNSVGILTSHGIHTWDFGSQNYVRYNVFQNCSSKAIFLASRGGPDYICNNVFYNNKYKNVAVVVQGGKNGAEITVADNIFFQTMPGQKFAENPNIRYDANCYWGEGNFPAADAHAVKADPRFVAPGQGGVGSGNALAFKTLDGYKLQAGSPCLGKGVVVPSDAKTDFWGTALKVNRPSIGSYDPK